MWQVSENVAVGTFVGHVTVIDKDSGQNGRVNCSLITEPASPPAFQLVPRYPTEYQLITAAVLDRELIERYHVTIRCQDGGGGDGNALDAGKVSRVSEKSLEVLVGDVNDHAPVFSRQTYEATITENNYIGLSVLQVLLLLTYYSATLIAPKLMTVGSCGFRWWVAQGL